MNEKWNLDPVEQILYRYGLVAISAAAAFAAHELIDWKNTASSTWAAWAAATGTILAFAGTTYLATQEARRRRREALNLATITAITLRSRILRSRGEWRGMIESNEEAPLNFEQCLVIKSRLDSHEFASKEELADLVPLGMNIAIDLAEAYSEAQLAKAFLFGIESVSWQGDEKGLQGIVVASMRHLLRSVQKLESASSSMRPVWDQRIPAAPDRQTTPPNPPPTLSL